MCLRRRNFPEKLTGVIEQPSTLLTSFKAKCGTSNVSSSVNPCVAVSFDVGLLQIDHSLKQTHCLLKKKIKICNTYLLALLALSCTETHCLSIFFPVSET